MNKTKKEYTKRPKTVGLSGRTTNGILADNTISAYAYITPFII